MCQIPWAISWGSQSISGCHPYLPSWTISKWKGDFTEIENAVRRSLLAQMLDYREIDLETASLIELKGYVVQVPLPEDVVHRCDVWDHIHLLARKADDPLHFLAHELGVSHHTDLVTRLSPVSLYDRWWSWRKEIVDKLLALSEPGLKNIQSTTML